MICLLIILISYRKLVLKQDNCLRRVNIELYLCLSPPSDTKSFNFLRITSSHCFCTSMCIYHKTTSAATTAQWIWRIQCTLICSKRLLFSHVSSYFFFFEVSLCLIKLKTFIFINNFTSLTFINYLATFCNKQFFFLIKRSEPFLPLFGTAISFLVWLLY